MKGRSHHKTAIGYKIVTPAIFCVLYAQLLFVLVSIKHSCSFSCLLLHSVYGTFVPWELSRLRTFLPVNFRAREHNPNPSPNPNPNPGTEELSCLSAKVPLARKFRLPLHSMPLHFVHILHSGWMDEWMDSKTFYFLTFFGICSTVYLWHTDTAQKGTNLPLFWTF